MLFDNICVYFRSNISTGSSKTLTNSKIIKTSDSSCKTEVSQDEFASKMLKSTGADENTPHQRKDSLNGPSDEDTSALGGMSGPQDEDVDIVSKNGFIQIL